MFVHGRAQGSWIRRRGWRTAAGIGILATAALVAVGCGDGGGDEDDDGDGGDYKVVPAFSADQLNQPPTDSWPTNGGSLTNQRHSPLDEIDRDNVTDLKGEWKVDLDSGDAGKHSAEAQPLYHDGTLYVVTGDDDVFAIDVETGEQKWKYDGELDQAITTVCCGWTSRGVAIGEDKVYLGKLDASLVAIDAETGEEEWSTQIGEWEKGDTITSAPLYYDGRVYTGVSGGEYGIRGRLTAVDAETGKEDWKFYTIPGPGEVGHDTWPQDTDAWEHGGAPIWQTPSVDPELGLLYFATGNVSPDFDGTKRQGDNLFSSSIVAIDADSGEYEWHFQQVHHDIWDYDSPSPVVLFEAEYDGEERKALAQPSKTGWVYILDREDGEPLVGIEEKPVPQEPRQHTSPTQPFPVGDSFVPQSITEQEAARLRALDPEADWSYVNGGKIFTPFFGKAEGVIAKPATLGGSNWPPSSYSPDTGYLYVCGADTISVFTQSEAIYEEGRVAGGESFLGSAFTAPKGVRVTGSVTAMDMRDNTIAWQKNWDESCYSGTVNTAGGLLFVGRNSGELQALDVETGDELWSFQTGAGANSTVTTFEHDGTQYVAFYAGGNSLAGTAHGDNMWLFSLEGELGPAPAAKGLAEDPADEADAAADGGDAAAGGEVEETDADDKPEEDEPSAATDEDATTDDAGIDAGTDE